MERAPLSLKLPGVRGAPRHVDNPVSLLDIAPTVFELAGAVPSERLDGESLLPLARGAAAQRQKPILFECGWHVCPNPAVSALAELPDGRRLMYTYNLTSDLDELYDLDDLTYRDLSQDPAYADVRAQMTRYLAAVLESDPRWTCYWHTMRLAKYEELDVAEGDLQMLRPERR